MDLDIYFVGQIGVIHVNHVRGACVTDSVIDDRVFVKHYNNYLTSCHG